MLSSKGATLPCGPVSCSLLALAAFILFWVWARAPITAEYVAVIDCGSSGTRIYVFTWKYDDSRRGMPSLQLIPPSAAPELVPKKSGQSSYNRVETLPGLDSFADRPEPELEALSLGPLLTWARAVIHPRQLPAVPIFLFATAGVRRMPQAKQGLLMERTRGVLQRSGFRFDPSWARIISGTDEGVYGWIAINYLRGYLDGPTSLAVAHAVAAAARAGGTGAATAVAAAMGRRGGGGGGGSNGAVAAGGTTAAAAAAPGAALSPVVTVGSLDLGGSSLEMVYCSEAIPQVEWLQRQRQAQLVALSAADSFGEATHAASVARGTPGRDPRRYRGQVEAAVATATAQGRQLQQLQRETHPPEREGAPEHPGQTLHLRLQQEQHQHQQHQQQEQHQQEQHQQHQHQQLDEAVWHRTLLGRQLGQGQAAIRGAGARARAGTQEVARGGSESGRVLDAAVAAAEEEPGLPSRDLLLGARHYTLRTHTFHKYGLNDAFDRAVSLLLQDTLKPPPLAPSPPPPSPAPSPSTQLAAKHPGQLGQSQAQSQAGGATGAFAARPQRPALVRQTDLLWPPPPEPLTSPQPAFPSGGGAAAPAGTSAAAKGTPASRVQGGLGGGVEGGAGGGIAAVVAKGADMGSSTSQGVSLEQQQEQQQQEQQQQQHHRLQEVAASGHSATGAQTGAAASLPAGGSAQTFSLAAAALDAGSARTAAAAAAAATDGGGGSGAAAAKLRSQAVILEQQKRDSERIIQLVKEQLSAAQERGGGGSGGAAGNTGVAAGTAGTAAQSGAAPSSGSRAEVAASAAAEVVHAASGVTAVEAGGSDVAGRGSSSDSGGGSAGSAGRNGDGVAAGGSARASFTSGAGVVGSGSPMAPIWAEQAAQHLGDDAGGVRAVGGIVEGVRGGGGDGAAVGRDLKGRGTAAAAAATAAAVAGSDSQAEHSGAGFAQGGFRSRPGGNRNDREGPSSDERGAASTEDTEPRAVGRGWSGRAAEVVMADTAAEDVSEEALSGAVVWEAQAGVEVGQRASAREQRSQRDLLATAGAGVSASGSATEAAHVAAAAKQEEGQGQENGQGEEAGRAARLAAESSAQGLAEAAGLAAAAAAAAAADTASSASGGAASGAASGFLVVGRDDADVSSGIPQELRLRHPCMHEGFARSYNRIHHHDVLPQQSRVQLVGAPDWAACLHLVSRTVNASAGCSGRHCVLGSAQPELKGPFVALAGFYVVWTFFGLHGDHDPAAVTQAAHAHCARPWHVVESRLGHHINVEKYCLWGPYVAHLLTAGLGLASDEFAIGSGDVGWPIGAALAETLHLPGMGPPVDKLRRILSLAWLACSITFLAWSCVYMPSWLRVGSGGGSSSGSSAAAWRGGGGGLQLASPIGGRTRLPPQRRAWLV